MPTKTTPDRARRGEQAAERPPLTGLLAEFRDAIEAEIAAVKSASGANAVHLRGGRRVLQGAGFYQYAFQLDFPRRMAIDAPAELVVGGSEPVTVTVAGMDGLTVVIASPIDFGPAIPSASLQSDLVFLLRKLVERIEQPEAADNPVGDRLLRERGEPRAARDQSPTFDWKLAPEQAEAVTAALSGDVFIWGPPGTGKTSTIGAICAELIGAGKSVLLVSHTNAAANQGLLKAVTNLEKAKGIPAFEEGALVRVGQVTDPRLLDDQVSGRPSVLLPTIAANKTEGLRLELEEQQQRLRELQTTVSELKGLEDLAEFVAVSGDDLARFQDQASHIEQLDADGRDAADALAAARAGLHELERLLAIARDVQGRDRQILALEQALVEALDAEATARGQLNSTRGSLADAQDVLDRSEASGRLARAWRNLPNPAEQHHVVAQAQLQLDEATQQLTARAESVSKAQAQLADAQREREDLAALLGDRSTEEVVADHQNAADECDRQDRESTAAAARLDAARRDLRSKLELRVHALVNEKLLDERILDEPVERQLDSVKNSIDAARDRLSGRTLADIKTELAATEAETRGCAKRVDELQQQIANAEVEVITEAQMIATTLTQTYLKDPIVDRRFDVVILDEASMAPIPAVHFAAGLADESAVVVGDFRQLPPIVQSEQDIATKWLGRDIFEVAGALDFERAGARPDWFVGLREQFRMAPAVSAIVNDLVYGKQLTDGASVRSRPVEEWLSDAWPHASDEVLLVDLSDTGAWVSLVPSGRHSSKVNFYSATVCVDLAEAMLAEQRDDYDPATDPRIAIVNPYKPHAALCELLLEQRRLVPEVRTGTAHAFQGSEADAVIIDLVNAPPAWKSGVFMPDQSDNDHNKRLFNVAVSRAKSRLIVVGHFDWVQRNANKQSFLAQLVQYLIDRHPMVSAEDLVPQTLHERVRQTQSLVDGDGEVASPHLIATEESYYPAVRADIDRAEEIVVVFSPFLAERRLLDMQASLRAAHDRGVRLVVVTKPPSEFGKDVGARRRHADCERMLREWGATVVHKQNAHEKLVFIDFERSTAVGWHGSLNTLSHRDTGELMTRYANREIVARFADAIGLRDILLPYAQASGASVCPVCRDANLMVVSNANKPPFSWRCEHEDHYWRGHDESPPVDGKLPCRNCGGDIYFGAWGDKPAWRCHENHQHRMKVHRDHLKLPKMVELIPKRELAALHKQLGVRGVASAALASDVAHAPATNNLFDDARAHAADQRPRTPRRRAPERRVSTKVAAPAGTGPPKAAEATPRERDLLRLLAAHRSRNEIAEELGLSRNTVQSYLKDLYRKLGVHERADAVKAARRRGWL